MQFVNQKKWFYKKFYKKSRRIKLGFKNIYIFPNLFGIYWILTSIFIYILGVNLENNFTIFICYLMITVLVISLFLTHFNIHGLELTSINQKVNFANSKINYQIILNTQKIRNNIKLKFLNKENKFIFIDKIENKLIKSLPIYVKSRGIYNPEIIYGESSSPLSLFNCWFYWRPVERFVVAPEKKKGNINQNHIQITKYIKNDRVTNTIGDELDDIQIYKKGEKKSLIHWKSFAKSKILLSKNFTDKSSNSNWLTLNKNIPLEKALEHLCFEIYDQYKNNKVYGLSLNKTHFINPDKNEKHYISCLTMLASFRDE